MDNINTKKNIGYRLATLFSRTNKKQKELAEYLEVKPNVISYFVNGERVPNTEQVIKIATFFNVSTDYLLGLTDVTTTDRDLKFICDYTGLSEEAINALAKFIRAIPEEEDLAVRESKYTRANIANNFFIDGYFEVILLYTLSYLIYRKLGGIYEMSAKIKEDDEEDTEIKMIVDRIMKLTPSLFTCEHLAKGMLSVIQETATNFAKNLYSTHTNDKSKAGEP